MTKIVTRKLLTNKKIGSYITIILLVSLLLYASRFLIANDYEDEATPNYFVKMEVTYRNMNTQESVWNLTEEYRSLGLFMNTSWQKVIITEHSHMIESFEKDEDGNLMAIIDLSNSTMLNPGENVTYTVEYGITLAKPDIPEISEKLSLELSSIPKNLKDRFCSAQGPWQVNSSTLINLANSLAGSETTVLSILKNIISWIVENIHYRSGEVPRYPLETVTTGYGDCDDQANLLVTFCRILGIPAYLQIGCIYLPGTTIRNSSYWEDHLITTLKNIGWHGWAAVFVPPWGWLPVDLTYAYPVEDDVIYTIRNSALFSFPTIQYANVTRYDYIASSLGLRDYISSNNFFITETDVMFTRE